MQQNYLDKPLEVNPENPGREITWYRREHNKLTPSNDITDCTFIINGDEIRVHKVILIWHSPVFKKMFSGEMASDTIGKLSQLSQYYTPGHCFISLISIC
ncbi:uncharacterized protein LOC123012878 isoform X2 [Tribolium madens]|uniref:uncharacterized protein LOC123012878 isoform X2 n=1 Tax=Tribolium madens TaxID=41895 RepID=UPI001CF7578D|nr:uncharacterized protein LOC123012878 isoform X2 [Tribolium madens]